MIKAILGKKIDQTQVFDDQGNRIPVTRISTGPCYVVSLKTQEIDGYDAVLLGFGQRRTTTIKKPILGIIKKAGLDKSPPRFLKEIKLEKADEESSKPSLGDKINASDIFKEGDLVNITGKSIGKGFAGVVKRHHFKGGPRTHGQSDRERAPGSIGQTTTPGRVYKGKRMAGRMGGNTVTVRNLKVIKVDSDKNMLFVKGLVAGKRNNLLLIKKV